MRICLVLLCTRLGLAVRAELRQHVYGPFQSFKTEPTFQAHSINVSITPSDPALLSPGYYFIAPSTLFGEAFGPHIIDRNGQVAWYGNDSSYGRTMEFYACNYGNATHHSHLCVSQGRHVGTEVRGPVAMVLDETYTQVSTNFSYDPEHPEYMPGEGHEFNMLESGVSYITATRKYVNTDLTGYYGPSNGTVRDACWQHVEIASYRKKDPLFTWCALDPGHLNIWDTEVYLNQPSSLSVHNYTDGASGLGIEERPWDLFHQNSIDLDHDGNYLVSLRHADQVILVAGPNTTHPTAQPGDIIWRLGGTRNNDFTMVGDWTFSRQHHIRYHASNETHLTVSLFNNGWTERTEEGLSGRVSSGQIISIDNSSMTAHLVQEYPHPFGTAANVSVAQGATHIQPDGNVVVGWGSVPELTEFSPSGEVLWHARFASMEGITLLSYRAYKFPWTGRPKYPPKLLAYRENCDDDDAPLLGYVSWNGATEVAYWRFWVRFGWPRLWIYAGHAPRNGFETKAELSSLEGSSWTMRVMSKFLRPHWQEVFVQGVDSEDRELGHTTATTFVPNLDLYDRCDDEGCTCIVGSVEEQGCTVSGNFLYEPNWSRGIGQCQRRSSSVAVAVLTAAIVVAFVITLLRLSASVSRQVPGRLVSLHTWKQVQARLQDGLDSGYASMARTKWPWQDSGHILVTQRRQEYSAVPLHDYSHDPVERHESEIP